jgi:hypothetical protein
MANQSSCDSSTRWKGFVPNALLSGDLSHVYSEPDGRQQLDYQSKDKTRTWSVTEIDDLAHRFENYSIALRDLMKEIWNI